MNPLLCYVRARLRRRLFAWFGATILFTGLAVCGIMAMTEDHWRKDGQRLHAFAGSRFEKVWDAPEERDELVRSLSEELGVTVRLEATGGALVSSAGPPCNARPIKLEVKRGGAPLGTVNICSDRLHTAPWKLALPLMVTGLFLWAASSAIAHRISKPMGELSRVAHQLGSGNFAARVELRRHHQFGEAAALAITMNDMAARIERHLAEQRELLATVSHELRTPLARIRLLTELARGDHPKDKLFDDLDREVVEIDSLVGDLLASSRMDFAALSRRPLDAVETATRALERAGADPTALVVEREDESELDTRASKIEVQADPTLLGRALSNLIDNARRHGGGLDALRVKREGGHVTFEVEDRGEGFAEGEEARVFEPFYRRSENGTLGLGLALVRRIAEAHGGRAYAANRGVGGALVGLELPLVGGLA